MARVVFRILFLISLTFNVAFVLHMMISPAHEADRTPDLNLTAAQEKQVREIRLQIHRENETFKGEIRLCQERLMVALRSDEVDIEATNQCLDSIAKFQKKIQENSVIEVAELKKILNPEQCDCLMEGISSHMNQSTAPCSKPCCNPGL